jgi:8-oxo-dGTP diphosphatase
LHKFVLELHYCMSINFNLLQQITKQAGIDKIEKIAVGCIVYIQSLNQVLLIKRAESESFSGLWELPSGKVEVGEGLIEACLRELEEETGIVVDKVDHYCGFFDYQTPSNKLSRQFNFKVTLGEIPQIKLNPIEHSEFRFISLEDIEPELKNSDFKISEEIEKLILKIKSEK